MRLMFSIIKVGESIKNQMEEFVAYKGLAEGLKKKSVQINQILFFKFIRGNWDNKQRNKIILEMRDKKVFPFTKIIHSSYFINMKLNAWRYLINLRPAKASEYYAKFNSSYK